jgi:hypothetical protein
MTAPKKWYRQLEAGQMAFLPPLFAGMMRLLHRSCHQTLIGAHYVAEVYRTGKPGLMTSWHFAFPAILYHFRNQDAVLMVSRSRDGEFAARTLGYLGYQVARGSPGKGGAQALRSMLSIIQQGYHAGLVADGSQGPARVAQKGILLLARYAEAPLVPASMAAHPCWQFRSWDRTVLAKPFSHVVLAFGPPIRVDREASAAELERKRKELEDSLNELTHIAQLRARQPP